MDLARQKKIMWAGVFEDHIAAEPEPDGDSYLPVRIALFASEKEARKHFQSVVKVDIGKLLKVPKSAVKSAA
jgi:hypothetical protein